MAFYEAASHLLQFHPKLIDVVWMLVVFNIAITAFEVAGTVLVLALMIPLETANSLPHRVGSMFIIRWALAAATIRVSPGLLLFI